MENKILIVSYFIGKHYNSIGKIERWINNILQYLLIDCNRKIVIYTDNLNAIQSLNDKYKNIIFEYFNYKLDTYYLLCIKYHLIFKAFLKYKNNYNYICFAQSNINLFNNIYLKDLISNKHKLQLVYHFIFKNTKESFIKLYGDNSETCVDIKEKINNFDNTWKYYQSGLSTYTPDIFLWLYNEINNRMLLDFYNHKFVKWHDETYLNYIINVILKDKSILNIKYYNDKFNFLNKKNRILY